jgi:hypothetical protein
MSPHCTCICTPAASTTAICVCASAMWSSLLCHTQHVPKQGHRDACELNTDTYKVDKINDARAGGNDNDSSAAMTTMGATERCCSRSHCSCYCNVGTHSVLKLTHHSCTIKYNKLMSMPTARHSRFTPKPAFSTRLQLAGGCAPKPPLIMLMSIQLPLLSIYTTAIQILFTSYCVGIYFTSATLHYILYFLSSPLPLYHPRSP